MNNKKQTETITWHPVTSPPDSDTTVLLDPEDGEVWPGYLDGDQWRWADGMPASPTRWAHMPTGGRA